MNAAAGRSLLREFITEPDTNIVSDNALDYYLNRGQEALNDLIGYHVTDDTSITTVNGTQEYTLPTDALVVVWVEWNTSMLERLTQEEFRDLGTDFRDAAAGTPEKYYLHGRKIGLYPKPNAAQTLRIRYVSTPADYASDAFAQLPTQDHRLVVYYAAHLWLIAHGLDANFARADKFLALFTAEATAAKAMHDTRRLAHDPR